MGSDTKGEIELMALSLPCKRKEGIIEEYHG